MIPEVFWYEEVGVEAVEAVWTSTQFAGNQPIRTGWSGDYKWQKNCIISKE